MVVSKGQAAVIDAVRTVEAYEEFAKEQGADNYKCNGYTLTCRSYFRRS